MSHRVRWGVLGCARHALLKAVPAIQECPNAEVVAIGSRDLARAEECARKLNIPRAAASYEAILEDPNVDAVFIPLPNHLHASWTIRAMQAGKHVLCEKPAGLTHAEALEITRIQQTTGLKFMEGFMYRFHPQYRHVRELIGAGAVGELRMVRVSFSFLLDEGHTGIRVNAGMGGGALLDLGCYGVDLCCWLMGEQPKRTMLWADRSKGEVDFADVGVLEFQRERLGLFDVSFLLARRNTCEIAGTDGKIEVTSAFTTKAPSAVIVSTGGKTQVREFEPVDLFRLEFEHFSNCVLKGEAPLIPVGDSLRNAAVLEELRSAGSAR